jgi:hypothetical protein
VKRAQNTGAKRGQPARNPEPSSLGRSPRSTNISSFYDSANGSRDPGAWPSLLRRAWEQRAGQPVQPLPLGPDNIESRGSRASQYTS